MRKKAAVSIAKAKELQKAAQLIIEECSLFSSQDIEPPVELSVCGASVKITESYYSSSENKVSNDRETSYILIRILTVLTGAFPQLLSDIRNVLMTQIKHIS